MRVDAHIHVFPDRLAWAVRNALQRDGRLTASPLLADIAENVRASGFDRAWALPYAHRAGVAESLNEWSATKVRRYPWLEAGATFHPDDEHLPKLAERALSELGLRVVKLHCSVGNFSPNDSRLTPLWEMAAALGVPVVAHAGRRSPGATEPDELDELRPVLRAHPRLRLVLAHSGLPSFDRTFALMREFENLYADLTPVMDLRVDVGAAALVEFAGRFLFGSDSPNHPDGAAKLAAESEALGLPATALEELMGGAAARLVPA